MPNTRIVFDDNTQATSPVALALARLTQTLALDVPRLRMEQEDRANAQARTQRQDSLADEDRAYRRSQDEAQLTRQGTQDTQAEAQRAFDREDRTADNERMSNADAAQTKRLGDNDSRGEAQSMLNNIHARMKMEMGGDVTDQEATTERTVETDNEGREAITNPDGTVTPAVAPSTTRTTTKDPGAKRKGGGGAGYAPSQRVRAMIAEYRKHPHADKAELAWWDTMGANTDGASLMSRPDTPQMAATPAAYLDDSMQDAQAALGARAAITAPQTAAARLQMAPAMQGLPATAASQGFEAAPDTRALAPWVALERRRSMSDLSFDTGYDVLPELRTAAPAAEGDFAALDPYAQSLEVPGDPSFSYEGTIAPLRMAHTRMQSGHKDAVQQYDTARTAAGRALILRRDALQARQKNAQAVPASGASR